MAKTSTGSTPAPIPFEQRVRVEAAAKIPPALDALVLGVYEDGDRVAQGAADLPEELRLLVEEIIKLPDFKGKPGAVHNVPGRGTIKRVVLAGLGKRDQADADVFRWAGAAVARLVRGLEIHRCGLVLPGNLAPGTSAPVAARGLAEGILLGAHAYEQMKPAVKKPGAAEKKPATGPVLFTIIISEPQALRDSMEPVRAGAIVGEATNYARTLASTPGNVMHPGAVVAEARRMAREFNLKCTVIDAAEAKKLGMNGLLAVGEASAYPPALVILEHTGGRGAKTLAVVGKTVTFDTGGISIKPAADMDAMKYDKCGGMAVLGLMRAVSQLRLPNRVLGVLPIAENAVGGKAYRPGDILTMANGKTVEITNTDAEGRLILADALSYVCQTYQPRAVVDMATLTGGVIVALGGVYGGLFSNNDELAQALEKAGQASGDWLWRLPLHPRYEPLMEGYHANLQNSGIREAHPVQGGIFLQHFVPADMPWAHLDIAGVATTKKEDRYISKGASGFGVRLLVRLLEDYGER